LRDKHYIVYNIAVIFSLLFVTFYAVFFVYSEIAWGWYVAPLASFVVIYFTRTGEKIEKKYLLRDDMDLNKAIKKDGIHTIDGFKVITLTKNQIDITLSMKSVRLSGLVYVFQICFLVAITVISLISAPIDKSIVFLLYLLYMYASILDLTSLWLKKRINKFKVDIIKNKNIKYLQDNINEVLRSEFGIDKFTATFSKGNVYFLTLKVNARKGLKQILGVFVAILGFVFYTLVLVYGFNFGFITIFPVALASLIVNYKNYETVMHFYKLRYVYIKGKEINPYDNIVPKKYFENSEDVSIHNSKISLNYYLIPHTWLVRNKINQIIQKKQ